MRRTLLASLVVAAGCSRNAAEPADARAADARPVAPADARPADAAPPRDAPGTPDAQSPTLTSVTLQQYGRVAPQGAGDVYLDAVGTGLAFAQNARAGTLEVYVMWSEPTVVHLRAVVPHGAAIGDVDLEITTVYGTARLVRAFAISEITVGDGGNDLTGLGTPASPFATLAHGLLEAASGDTVLLLDGYHSVRPLVVGAGIRVRGASRAGTSIGGPLSPGQILVELDGAELSRLTVDGPAGVGIGVYLTGDSALRGVTVQELDVGLLLGGRATLEDVALTGNLQVGAVASSGTADLAGVQVSGGARGIDLHGDASLRVRGSSIAGSDVALRVDSEPRSYLDLGTAASAGGNALSGGTAAVLDQRPARAAPDGVVITLSGTTLQGASFPAGTQAVGPAENAPYWRIVNASNRLAFP